MKIATYHVHDVGSEASGGVVLYVGCITTPKTVNNDDIRKS